MTEEDLIKMIQEAYQLGYRHGVSFEQQEYAQANALVQLKNRAGKDMKELTTL